MINLLLCIVSLLLMLVLSLTFALLLLCQRQTQTQKQLQNLQADLEQQVQTLDTILSASPDQFYMFAKDRRFIYANRAALQSLNMQQSDLIGKTEQDLPLPPEILAQHKARLESVFATKHSISGEISFESEGGIKWVEYLLIPILDASGSVMVVVAISRDVTRRLQEEEELSQYRLHLEDLVAARTAELAQTMQELRRQCQYRQLLAEIALRIRESLEIDLILQTTVTELQKLLQADRVLFYRFLPNFNGKVVAESVLNPWPSTLGRKLLDHCFEEQYLKQYQQEIHLWPDVEEVGFQPCHLEMLRQFGIRANLIVPIFLIDKTWGLLFVQQCSSTREWQQFEVELLRQLADQLSIALAQAQLLEKETHYSQELTRSNEELQQFAYVASHDLQEPLRTISSYSKLLSRRYQNQLDTKANRFLQYLIDESQRMQTLINDLLWYSRVGRQPQNFGVCDCEVVLDIVLNRLEESITNSGAEISCNNLPRIMADQTQLIQLFQNLIANAIKYRSSLTPIIQIAAGLQEGEWLFSVRDNGIGIDPKYQERIFVIFQRLHTQEEYPGTGIGLAIAAKIVERHKGRIWVESVLGQGSTFYFTIPESAETAGKR